MKTIFRAILISLVLSSCNTELQSEAVEKNISQTAVGDTETEKPGEINTSSQKSGSLIGKTTVEIEKLGWFSCRGTIIDFKAGEVSYAVSKLARSEKECSNGRGKILLERFIRRNGNKAVFEVIDEIDIQSSYPENEYNWTTCKVKGAGSEELYVIHFKDQQQSELTNIYDLWFVDIADGKFVKVKRSEGLTCVNNDYINAL